MRLLMALSLMLLTSCSTIVEKKRSQFEDCVIKMTNSDIPGLKALRICQTIYKEPKDIRTEEQLMESIKE